MNKTKSLRKSVEMTQPEFANYFNVPLATLKKWELPDGASNARKIPPYLFDLMQYKLEREGKIIKK